MRYRPELDGMRALAVLAVFAVHAQGPFTAGGWMGVDVFFVLSGYLITALLLSERGRTGSVSLRHFYLRRVLRLYPALLAVLLVGVFFYRDLGDGGTLVGYGRTFLLSALYIQDFALGFNGQPYGGVGQTWSLGVEEQFYLVWPPVMLFLLARGRDPLRWAIGGTLVSWALMDLFVNRTTNGSPVLSYYLPWSRFGQLLVGCALALVLARRPVPEVLRRSAVGWLLAVAACGLVLVGNYKAQSPNMSWEAPTIALLSAGVIAHLTAAASGSLRAVLAAGPLAWLGRRSYGVYLIHVPVIDLLTVHLHRSRSFDAAIALVVTIALAAVSYRFLELPFLRLKSRYQPAAESSVDS